MQSIISSISSEIISLVRLEDKIRADCWRSSLLSSTRIIESNVMDLKNKYEGMEAKVAKLIESEKILQKKLKESDEMCQSLKKELRVFEQTKVSLDSFLASATAEHRNLIQFKSKEGESIFMDHTVALNASPYLKGVLENSLCESRTRTISLKESSLTIAKLIVAFLHIDPALEGSIKVPQLSSEDAYQLMEISSIYELPWVCNSLAERLEQFTVPDLQFYSKCQLQLYSDSRKSFASAWMLASKKAAESIALNIETDKFPSQFEMKDLETIITIIKDEEWPKLTLGTSEPSSSNGFSCVVIKQEDGSVRARIAISPDNKKAVRLASKVGGLFRGVVAIVRSENIDRESPQTTEHLHTSEDLLDFHDVLKNVSDPADVSIHFKASFTALHRRCCTLVKYFEEVIGAEGRQKITEGSWSLLEALSYFHHQSSCAKHQESAKLFTNYLFEYAARSFALVRDYDSLLTLDLTVVEKLVKSDDLWTDQHEDYVLKFVVRYSKTYASSGRGADEPDNTDKSGHGREEGELKDSAPEPGPSCVATNVFDSLLKRVRFPFIQLPLVLSDDEQPVASQSTVFKNLLADAISIQGGIKGPADSPGARKRARYGDIPRVDLGQLFSQFMVEWKKEPGQKRSRTESSALDAFGFGQH